MKRSNFLKVLGALAIAPKVAAEVLQDVEPVKKWIVKHDPPNTVGKIVSLDDNGVTKKIERLETLTEPPSPRAGSVYMHVEHRRMYVYTGEKWIPYRADSPEIKDNEDIQKETE